METLRTRIPHLIQMLMDKRVTLEFSNEFPQGPMIAWKYENGAGGHAHLDTFYIPGEYGANALQIESELVMIFAELPQTPTRKADGE